TGVRSTPAAAREARRRRDPSGSGGQARGTRQQADEHPPSVARRRRVLRSTRTGSRRAPRATGTNAATTARVPRQRACSRRHARCCVDVQGRLRMTTSARHDGQISYDIAGRVDSDDTREEDLQEDLQDWYDALEEVRLQRGDAAAARIVEQVVNRAREVGIAVPVALETPYVNTIDKAREP